MNFQCQNLKFLPLNNRSFLELPMITVAPSVGGVARELDQDISGSTSAPRLSEIRFGVRT